MTHSSHGGCFAKTQWTVIWAAKADDSVIARQARERLCQTYRQPVYWFCLRQGCQPADAEDLVQDFFARLLHEKSWLNHLQHQQGRFRNFLLTVLKNFLSDHRDREMAQKRGGGKQKVSLDDTAVGAAIQHGGLTPDEMFDRKWADSLFQTAARALRDEYHARDKGPLYEAIKDLVPGQHGERSYAEIAAALGMTEPAIKNAVYRFRERQRELIREEVAATVETPQQLEEELQYLIELLSR